MTSTAWRAELEGYETAQRAAGRAAGTIRLNRHYLRQLARLHPDPWQVTADDLAGWLAAPAWAPETRKTARTAVRGFYRWARRTGRLAVSPADVLDPVSVPRAIPRPASETAVEAALEAGTDRERLMVLCAAYGGLRAHEVARVHPGNVDWLRGDLRVRGKGGRERRVPLHPLLAAELGAELERRRAGSCGTGWRYTGRLTMAGPDGWLFPNGQGGPVTAGNVTRTLSALLGEHWTAHTLRHRFATAAYAVERDLRAVQELLGHSKPETTARYTQVPADALRSAVHGIGGGAVRRSAGSDPFGDPDTRRRG